MAKTNHQKTIASIKRTRTKRLATLITKSYYYYRKKDEEKVYNLICEEFMGLGGVYVKFLQGVLLRSKVMRKWHNPEKLKIFENLDHEPLQIGSILQRELSKDKLSQIAMVQPEPFAAGSFGQVYYAQLRSGQPVIIKVLRPMIRELLKHDIKLLGRFSKSFFSRLYKNMNVQLNEAMKDFSEATLRETDYRHEAEFANEMYEHYKHHPTIYIPKTYLELCTDNIIVQDYVDGISVAQIIGLHEQGVEPVQYVKETLGSDIIKQLQTFGYESMIAIFEIPRIQGDPHPGNIRLMRDNRVGIIDFGISATPPEDKSGLFGLLESYDKVFKGSQTAIGLFENGLKFFVSDLYRSLRKLGDYLGRSDSRDYVNEISQVAEQVFSDATGTNIIQADFKSDASILVVINKLVNKGNRFGLVMKLEATEILRAIQTYTSLLSSLGLYQRVMPALLSHTVEYVRDNYPEVANDNRDSISIADALETVANWLERVADRDPLLFRQLSEKIRTSAQAKPVLTPEGVENV
jgi:hypothetical protein